MKSGRNLIMVLTFALCLMMTSKANGNDIVDTITNNSVNHGTLSYLPSVADYNDRKEHASAAQNDTSTGKAIAIATGIALTGAGAELLSHWWSPSDMAAGAELMHRGTLEFAQAGQDNGVANDNGAQKILLSNETGQAHLGYNPSGAQNQLYDALSGSPLAQTLAQSGVDLASFTQQVASGNIMSADQITGTLGINPGTLSSEDQAKVSEIVDGRTNAILSTNGSEGKTIDYDSSQGKSGALASADGGIGLAGDSIDLTRSNDWIKSHGPAALEVANAATEAVAGAYNSSTINSLFTTLFPDDKKVTLGQQALAVKGKLEKAGVKLVRAKENLFQVAKRNYKDYQHWRKMNGLTTASADIR